ncbi:hypothetical protein KC19_4G270300 [Ceratodon purpureus]|uniref:Uncharacterized protein n=1 Tax=Ceratodon purpureus TaxID=3225 RepID=A0A8T0IGK1_CERPU|nr:hypothetical protein KC19_4G270300 [Ceratodon purpureus]
MLSVKFISFVVLGDCFLVCVSNSLQLLSHFQAFINVNASFLDLKFFVTRIRKRRITKG